MQKIYFFIAFVLFQTVIGQTPIFSHSLNSLTSNNYFTLSSQGVGLSQDYYLRDYNAVKFSGNHTGLVLDFSTQTSLRSQGSVEFFHKHISDGNSNDYFGDSPILHLTNGATSSGGVYKSSLGFGIKTNSSSTYTIKAGNGSMGTTNNYTADSGVNTAVKNKWQHFVVTYKFGPGGYIKLYHNGILKINRAISFNTPSGMANKMVFNGYIENSNGTIVGSGTSELDNINVYSEILTDTEVAEKYANRYPIDKGSNAVKYTFNNSFEDQIGDKDLIIPSDVTLTYDNGATHTSTNKSGSFNNHVRTAGVYGSVPTSINNSLQNTYTVSFAYKQYTNLNDNTSNGTIPIIYIPTTDSTKPLIIGITKNNNTDKYPLAIQFGNTRIAANNFVAAAGIWVHATVVFNNGIMKVYINGDDILTQNISTHNYTPNPNANIQIAKSNNPNDWYRGLLDDVLIDNKAYSEAEAKALYAHHLSNFSNYDLSNLSVKNQHEVNKQTITLYPNPTTEEINIKGEVNYKNIKVYNSTSQSIPVQIHHNKVNVRHLNKGVYYIYFEDENGNSYTKSFIKK